MCVHGCTWVCVCTLLRVWTGVRVRVCVERAPTGTGAWPPGRGHSSARAGLMSADGTERNISTWPRGSRDSHPTSTMTGMGHWAMGQVGLNVWELEPCLSLGSAYCAPEPALGAGGGAATPQMAPGLCARPSADLPQLPQQVQNESRDDLIGDSGLEDKCFLLFCGWKGINDSLGT